MPPIAAFITALTLGASLSSTAQASLVISQPGDVQLIGLQPVSPAFSGWSTAGDVSAAVRHTSRER